MVRWVARSILHVVNPLRYFSFQPVLHDWCNKGCGMCYPVCGMVHIKEPIVPLNKPLSLANKFRLPFWGDVFFFFWSLAECNTASETLAYSSKFLLWWLQVYKTLYFRGSFHKGNLSSTIIVSIYYILYWS